MLFNMRQKTFNYIKYSHEHKMFIKKVVNWKIKNLLDLIFSALCLLSSCHFRNLVWHLILYYSVDQSSKLISEILNQKITYAVTSRMSRLFLLIACFTFFIPFSCLHMLFNKFGIYFVRVLNLTLHRYLKSLLAL